MQMYLHKLELYKSSRIPHMAEQGKTQYHRENDRFPHIGGKAVPLSPSNSVHAKYPSLCCPDNLQS